MNKNTADRFQSANTNVARPIDVLIENNADRFQSANNFARPIVKAALNNNNTDEIRSAHNDLDVIGSPEAQRLNSLIARQKQIIDRQNTLMRILADRQREQDAILDDSDSSPVARVARRLDLSDRSMQPPDRVTRRRLAHTRSDGQLGRQDSLDRLTRRTEPSD